MYKALSSDEEAARQKYYVERMDADITSFTLTLPFFHTCAGKNFRAIFLKKHISPTLCKEFKEDLTYYFYGKPSYRLSSDGKTSVYASRFPVCFVTSLTHACCVKRTFPFDTGALIHRVMEDVFGEELNPAPYNLGNSLDAVKKYVKFTYGNDIDYFYNRPKVAPGELGAFSDELSKILTLARDCSSKQWDNRGYTVEVQCDHKVELDSGQIQAIILPNSFLNEPELTDFLYCNDIEVLGYSLDRADPAHMTPFLIAKAEDYLKGKGLLP